MSDTIPNPLTLDETQNNLVLRGTDGDPLPDARATRMVEIESYERVIEGLKMSADACSHLAKQEPQDGQTWTSVALLLDRMRLDACKLAGIEAGIRQRQTEGARGNPYGWRRARDRFLEGLTQATGGMRQLATCFRGELQWSIMAQQLELRIDGFKTLLYGRRVTQRPRSPLILPQGYVRH